MREASGAPILRAIGLQRRYGPRLAVDVDALEVKRGEKLAVLGPNGAGKSTLFRLLLLLDRPQAGRIELDGQAVSPRSRDARTRLAGVFQRPYLFSGTVADNVAYGLRARRMATAEREARVAEALEAVALGDRGDSDVQELSGGEAQRVAVARALALRPDVLLMDEPTSALDVAQRRRFRSELGRMLAGHASAVLLITHDPADAFTLADRVAVMEAGRITQVATPEELVLEPATPFIAAVTGAELLLEGTVLDREGESLARIELDSGAELVAMLAGTSPEWARPGTAAHVAYRPEDVTVVPADAVGATSARNRFMVRVERLVPAGGLVRARLAGDVALTASLTRTSVRTLALEPGMRVEARIKATALRAYPTAEQRPERKETSR